MHKKKIHQILFFVCVAVSCKAKHTLQQTATNNVYNTQQQTMKENILQKLLDDNPQYFKHITDNKDSFRMQIIYTQINRDENNIPHFTQYSFNNDTSQYFYPASTVKFPIALLALEKLNNMAVAGVNKFIPMINDSNATGQTIRFTQPVSSNSAPTISNYIKQILLVSDNEAFNRLYEFLGQEYIQKQLASKGYTGDEMRHRLQVSLTEEQNRQTNAVSFFDTSGNLLFAQPEQYSHAIFQKRNTLLGKGYIKDDKLVNEPFNFSIKNKFYLQDLNSILRSIIFPETVDAKQRFNLTPDDYNFLYRYMSAYPRESIYPSYDTSEYYDAYCKFLFYGSEKVSMQPHIRIFNKVGDAYGFLTDISYFADFENKVEFFLSATIYCNSDGIFNDDKYDYDDFGYPFFKHLGQTVYNYELQRQKKYLPDLNKFVTDYSKEY